MHQFERKHSLLTLENVSLMRNNKLILRDIGTEKQPFMLHDIGRPGITQGQTIAVVGKSGGGKSTLFKVMAGLFPPTSGTVMLPSETFSKDRAYRCVCPGDIGFVQQNYPLSRNQTVQEMLLDAAKQGGIPKKDRLDSVMEYLKTWNLEEQRYNSARQLSGGQRQRVAIIEQIFCSDHGIVFDEVFSGLDVNNVDDVINTFEKITTTSDLGTVIFSTHDIRLAVQLADRIYVIGQEKENGKCLPGGTVIKFYDLMEMGLAWEEYGDGHRQLVAEIQNLIRNS